MAQFHRYSVVVVSARQVRPVSTCAREGAALIQRMHDPKAPVKAKTGRREGVG